MNKILHYAILLLSLFSHFSLPMAARPRDPYVFATIFNHNDGPIKITYFRPDPGFYGRHVIVRDEQELSPGQNARIMITKQNLTARRCVYQHPDAHGNYELFRTDSIEIPIDPEKNDQIILLGLRAAG